ncbi:ABC transporter permease [Bacillus suaedaesalsae]|uniref:Transport permease protein n=1 Tax=Bacillus suaedaesalsae TaxID=2810349 RepID=A0ABS2DKR3_9BACI|nr:ABC transporter permease [Bacillus suaedaesalsae]MBM6619082.1 ABC transporter permease [Bacillus suaedaesalsae]
MSFALSTLKEQISNIYLIIRLSIYELKSTNSNNYLGLLWEIINPMIQISIYWFVFGYGITEGKDVNGIPYLQWMLSGIAVWFFISPAVIQGSKSIYTRIKLIAKMNFPISAIPTFVIISKFYHHVVLVGIILVILQFYDFTISIYLVQLFYFMFAVIALLISLSLITSTLSTIVRDVQMVVQAIMRVLLYLSPILWTPDRLPEWVQTIMKINPFYYIVEGYRASLLGTSWYFIENIQYTLYFWGIVLILFLFGSYLLYKFRDQFVDYL